MEQGRLAQSRDEPDEPDEHQGSPVEEPVVRGYEGVEPVRRGEIEKAAPLGDQERASKERVPGDHLRRESEKRCAARRGEPGEARSLSEESFDGQKGREHAIDGRLPAAGGEKSENSAEKGPSLE